MRRLFSLAGLAAVLLACPVTPTRPAEACAIVSRSRDARIEGEEALIVWDAATRTEHFVRQASFAGADEPLGFLVPTPNQPTLAEADSRVFTRLRAIYARPAQMVRSSGGGRARSRGATSPSVVVVERRMVAGLDAAVLAATDARALNAWLGEHGFPSRPALEAWLRPYVRRGFFVTAFRYDPGAQQGRFATRAVRLSFSAPAPFYPYAEPSDAPRPAGRHFRLSVVAPYRVDARHGGGRWRTGRVGYADRLRDRISLLRGVVPDGAAADSSWLTTFEEPRSVRGRADLTFVRAGDPRSVASTIDGQIVPANR